MDAKLLMEYAAQLLSVLALLVFTNTILVEVLKIFIKKIPTSYLSVGAAQLVTLVAFFAFMSEKALVIKWYYVFAAFIAGIFVAYISMYGFDKFKETWEKTHSYRNK